VIFTVLFAVGVLASGDTPDSNATGEAVISYYDDTGKILVGVLTLAIGAVFMFFAGVLHSRLREAGPEWWPPSPWAAP